MEVLWKFNIHSKDTGIILSVYSIILLGHKMDIEETVPFGCLFYTCRHMF